MTFPRLRLGAALTAGAIAALSLAAAEAFAGDLFARLIEAGHLPVTPELTFLAGAIAAELLIGVLAAPVAAFVLDRVGLEFATALFLVLASLTVWGVLMLRGSSLLLIAAADLLFATIAVVSRQRPAAQLAVRLVAPFLAAVAVLVPLEVVTRFSTRFVMKAMLAGASLSVVTLLFVVAALFPRRLLLAAASVAGLLLIVSSFVIPPPRAVARRERQRAPSARENALPDVLLVTLDTTRADHLSLYGYQRDTSPNLQALARESTVFDRAVSAADVTLTSHASIFTGLTPHRHGAVTSIDAINLSAAPLAPEIPTLAEILTRGGYTTIGVAANHGYLARGFGLGRGFAVWDDRWAPPFDCDSVSIRCALAILASRFRRDTPPYRRAAEITAAAADAAHDTRRPLFLFVNYMDAHSPYLPPSPYNRKFGRGCGDAVHLERLSQLRTVKRLPMTEDVRRPMVDCYDGGIAAMDASLATLLAAMRDRHRPLLFVITNDHGELFGEHDLYEHSNGVYFGSTNAPLIVGAERVDASPEAGTLNPALDTIRKSAGTRVERPVSTTDIFATILNAAGMGRYAQGTDSVDLFTSREAREVVTAEGCPSRLWVASAPWLNHRTVLVTDGRYEWLRAIPGSESLYDVRADPLEQHDLSGAPELEEVRARLRASEPPAPRPPRAGRRDMELRRRLKSLGYIQ